MKKLVFADQLRSIAALSVVFVHLCGGYWAWRDVIAGRIMAPPLDGPGSIQEAIVGTFNFGPFGVSLFFLISGFVIPFSLDKMRPGRFLLARACRIYPTYIACLMLGLFGAWLSSLYWHHPFTVKGEEFLYNALLIQNIKGTTSLDLVNWTLSIEIKFYIVMAALAAVGAHRHVRAFLALSGAIVIANYFAPRGSAGFALVRDLAFMPYMLIGTVINLHMRGNLTARQALASIAGLAAMFHCIAFFANIAGRPMPISLDIYQLNIAAFALAYVARDKFRPNRIVDFLASISYPLYAVHSIVGYATLRASMSLGVPELPALFIAVALVVSLAYAVHRLIELPSTQLGKRLALPSSPRLSTSQS
ncbi:acyltransferase family protein [Burkholderia sp. SIMBA_062]|uniref:acyltransferase family protein n=1 Tax=Burkholderia sp. SIMBA_062 TaxID=3085803 RepID=UPI0039795A21